LTEEGFVINIRRPQHLFTERDLRRLLQITKEKGTLEEKWSKSAFLRIYRAMLCKVGIFVELRFMPSGGI
jgi:hypothetical protein